MRCQRSYYAFRRLAPLVLFTVLLMPHDASAAEYWRHKWFDFPNPLNTRVHTECAKWTTISVPCPTLKEPLRTCPANQCVGHTVRTEVERIDVVFVAAGPDSAEDAARNAIIGYVVGCGATAMAAANTAAAATPSPEPASRVAAGYAAAVASFKACVAAITASGVVGAILKQVDLKVENPKHWSPL